eukprot:CAMPEP_0178993606 /NCGR_PEP_ID=MMETSP0795-20121207/6795_1 /TAXON_ID=88552 /ORGANISM="Amoebophrya sp., Strain Ameob2" /LENGTH=130 /DNA_ID=CAMNT_0020685681 /DNA_START=156 /DNA_END=549 /DNA_ORIENTATION=+
MTVPASGSASGPVAAGGASNHVYELDEAFFRDKANVPRVIVEHVIHVLVAKTKRHTVLPHSVDVELSSLRESVEHFSDVDPGFDVPRVCLVHRLREGAKRYFGLLALMVLLHALLGDLLQVHFLGEVEGG